MNFYGSSIIFNNVPSEVYDLRIYGFDFSDPREGASGGNVSVYEEWLYRRETPYFYGRYYTESLEFDFTLGSFSYIDGDTRHAIQAWLLGKTTYLPLRIVQDDISSIVFNVILTQSTPLYVGNINYALTLHAKCDRPWGIYYPPVTTKTYSSGSVSESFNYINSSVYTGYNKPIVSFTISGSVSGSSGNFSIVNNSDAGRTFAFTGLVANETITVNNDLGIITSSGSYLRMGNFNRKFLRLVQGANNLTVSGSITQLTIDSVFSRGVGV